MFAKTIKKINGKKYWDELCVVAFNDEPTLPCEWIEFKIEKIIQIRMYGLRVLKKEK